MGVFTNTIVELYGRKGEFWGVSRSQVASFVRSENLRDLTPRPEVAGVGRSLGLRDSGIHTSMVTTRRNSGSSGGEDQEIPDLRDIIASQVGEVLHSLLPGLFDQMKREMTELVTQQVQTATTG
ncbi:hypothetical protein OSB04_024213 [Centaurea solstitialis]|uniref:Uncharacterized protein n=1 Tax=Centaurea solstitialis TaxID=347529 RepID=A0AA38WDN1_9ASTR|nr:hypothetical protein OSB04_024213 [Centaurea solstitialis]